MDKFTYLTMDDIKLAEALKSRVKALNLLYASNMVKDGKLSKEIK